MKIEDLLLEEKEELMELYKLYNEHMCTIEDLMATVEFISISGMVGEEFKTFLRGIYPYIALNLDNWAVDKDKLIKESDEALRFVKYWNKMISSLK